MPSKSRTPTIRGIGPAEDEISDFDIVEVDGEMPAVPRVSVSVPPPSRPVPRETSSSRLRAAREAQT